MRNWMLIETKHTKITAELEQRITGGYYREKLPPLRALMKEYQVSLQTISKAVKPLILSGLISPGPRGSAINHASAVRERYYAWGFLCSGSAEMTDVTHDFFQLIHRCLARDSYNMLFLDGHVGSFSPREIVAGNLGIPTASGTQTVVTVFKTDFTFATGTVGDCTIVTGALY